MINFDNFKRNIYFAEQKSQVKIKQNFLSFINKKTMKYNTERAEVDVSIQKRKNLQKEKHEHQRWRNSLISLHEVLNKLENDNLKRYNQEQPQKLQESFKYKNHKTQKNNYKNRNINKTQTGFKFTIQPQPWQNDNEIGRLRKQKNISDVSRSFHLTLPKYLQTQKLIYKHNRSSSTIDPSHMYTLRDGEYERFKKLKEIASQKDKFLTQNFNYTNEQKAKVSIIHLAHQKQHKKIEKILKYKANFIDKTGLKQQKINQHSKYLIQSLKSLSFGDMVPSKKQSSLKIQGNKRIKTLTSKDNIQSNEMKSFSCGKLKTYNENIDQLNLFPVKVSYSINRLKPELIKIDEHNKIKKHDYKVSFRLKRNWIFQNRQTSRKNLTQNSQSDNQKYFQKVSKITSHFLKINKLSK